jgi:hypothetical protein
LPIGILAVGGLVIELRRGFSLKQAMVYLSGALMFLVLVPVFYEDRFSLFLVPVLVLPAVRFLQWIGGRVLRGWNWRLVAQILAIGLVTWCVVLDVNAVKSTVDGEPREILRTREAFVRLSGEDRRGSNVAARKPQIAYYLNLNFGDWPQASNVAEFIAGLQRNRTSFLFFRQIDIKLCPELSELLDPTQTHKGLRPLVVVDSPRCILYKVEH